VCAGFRAAGVAAGDRARGPRLDTLPLVPLILRPVLVREIATELLGERDLGSCWEREFTATVPPVRPEATVAVCADGDVGPLVGTTTASGIAAGCATGRAGP